MFTFDIHNHYEIPLLTLCTPIKEEMYIIAEPKELKYSPVFDDLSELEFSISPIFNNGDPTPYFDLVKKRKLIHAEGLGWFVIQQVRESNDGSMEEKTVKCVGYEKTLDQYEINILDGTFKFYDALEPQKSLLGALLGQTKWKIGHIDTELWNKYRSFEFPDDTGVYSFMRSDMEDAYECVFEFDTENMLVNAYVKGNLVDKTDIVLTFDNLIKNIQIDETEDDLITALSVYGDNDLNIRTVNPLGTNVIYDFSYFKQPEWMTPELTAAVTAWENKVSSVKEQYISLLTRLKEENAKLIKLEGELTDLKSALDALEQVRTARIKAGQDISDITQQINAKQAEINAKQAEVDAQQVVVDNIRNQQLDINKSLQFTENFTEDQLIELQCYINAATYTNDNYTITDNMSYVEIQKQSQQLYEDGLKKLEQISVPNYNFEMDIVNFLFLIQYQTFIDQIKLGATVNAEVKKDFWVEPMLVKIVIDYDKPDNCKLVFSDSFRLMDSYAVFDEYDKEYSKSSKTINESKNAWDKATSTGAVDFVNDMRKDGLNLALTSVLNADNQSLVIDKHGLLGRVQQEDGNFDPEQVKLVNNMLVFTDDNWMTARAALGKIKMPDSENYAYGLIADVIIGQLVASSELVISNESNTFKVDAAGAELINAYFKLATDNGRSQIVLDPRDSSAIRIQTDTGQGLKDKFYVDLSGKIVAEDIVTKSGTIGGWQIKDNGLFSNWGDYIRSDGYGKLSLLTYTPSSANFDGNIYARNLKDKVQHVNMGDNSIDSEQLFDGAVGYDKLDWEVQSLFADLIEADKILARQIGDLDNRVDEIYADLIDTINIKVQDTLDAAKVYADYVVANNIKAENIWVNTINGRQVLDLFSYKSSSTLQAHSDSIKAAFGKFDTIEADIANLKRVTANVITTDYLASHNITTYGLNTGNLSADATNFASCTVRGNLNVSTLNYSSIKTKRITIPGVGAYTFWIV